MKLFGIDIWGKNSTAKLKRVEQFSQIMVIANNIARSNPQALSDLIRALLRPLQSEHILAVAERDDHQAPDQIDGNSFFFSNNEIFSQSKYFQQSAPKVALNLASDPILPTPWRRDGFVNALATIGIGKKCGAWIQEPNHVFLLWLPWGIGFVGGGNHSISSGILSGKNIPIIINEVYDFSPVLDLVKCDGATYSDKLTGVMLAEVTDQRRAAVFEIGRLMLQHQVKVGTQVTNS